MDKFDLEERLIMFSVFKNKSKIVNRCSLFLNQKRQEDNKRMLVPNGLCPQVMRTLSWISGSRLRRDLCFVSTGICVQ